MTAENLFAFPPPLSRSRSWPSDSPSTARTVPMNPTVSAGGTSSASSGLRPPHWPSVRWPKPPGQSTVAVGPRPGRTLEETGGSREFGIRSLQIHGRRSTQATRVTVGHGRPARDAQRPGREIGRRRTVRQEAGRAAAHDLQVALQRRRRLRTPEPQEGLRRQRELREHRCGDLR